MNLIRQVPGLVAPKLRILLESLALARHEVLWLCYHNVHGNHFLKKSKNLLTDEKIGELIFYMEEIANEIKSYYQVVEKYFKEFLLNFSHPELTFLLTQKYSFNLQTKLEETILNGIVHALNSDQPLSGIVIGSIWT